MLSGRRQGSEPGRLPSTSAGDHQLNDHQDGLMSAVLDRNCDGTSARKAGVMAVVVVFRTVQPGDAIKIACRRSRIRL
ncbi:hypothetical protein [uncultured Jannaschia sp.]|uniref:hypothetical protein n=1 Tax=uncultured Jannaschia sp. TaxID=293347 RepID=UPI002607BADA|nr:hypothetical protein [uncultured Jannaschia sp.]